MNMLNVWWLIPALVFVTAFALIKYTVNDSWQRVLANNVYLFLRGTSPAKPTRSIAMLIAAMTCLALTNPSTQSKDADSYRHSQGWIILADVSRSMTLEDITPTRLSAMRTAALDLASQAGASAIALIVYAGDAFIATPPSFDKAGIRNNLALLDYGIVPVEGSNLTRAVSLALSIIEGTQLLNARLFVLSDTGGFNSKSDAAIARLSTLGHRTDIILFGSEPSDSASFDLQTARAMARSGKGQLLSANSIGQVNWNELDLASNLSDSSLLTQTGLTSLRWRNQSHWLLLLALPLLFCLFYRELSR